MEKLLTLSLTCLFIDCIPEEDGTVAGSEAAEALEQSRAAEVGIATKVNSTEN